MSYECVILDCQLQALFVYWLVRWFAFCFLNYLGQPAFRVG